MTVKYNDYGELTMGGTSLKTLALSFGTPTIVYDEDQIRHQMRRYHSAFKQSGLTYNISYASKAFTCLQMVKLVQEEGLQLDVVSEESYIPPYQQVLIQNKFTSTVIIKQNVRFNMD